jgi:hypothetical protein
MWKKLGKLAATTAVEAFLGSFLDEAGRALGQRLFPNKEEEEEEPEDSGKKKNKSKKSKKKK